MKAFEKWWERILKEHGNRCIENGWCDDPDRAIEFLSMYKNQHYNGWKAALGEVLKLRETCPKGKDFEEYVAEWIEQELREKGKQNGRKEANSE